MPASGGETLPVLAVDRSWEDLLHGTAKPALEQILPRYLSGRRWFGGKARTIQSARIGEVIAIPHESPRAYLTLVHVRYAEGEPEIYRVPLTCMPAGQGTPSRAGPGVLARVTVRGRQGTEDGVLLDAMWAEPFLASFFQTLSQEVRYTGAFGEVAATPTRAFRQLLRSGDESLEPSVVKAEQSNTSVVYGKRFILKLYRRAQSGINPELEIGRFLTDRGFPCIAAVASALEHRPPDGEPSTVAILQHFLPNKGDAWRFTLEHLSQYWTHALARRDAFAAEPAPARPLLALAAEPAPALARELIGTYLERTALLGRRTGELHLALSHNASDPDFVPEPLTDAYQRDLAHAIDRLIDSSFLLLRQRLGSLPAPLQGHARNVLEGRGRVLGRIHAMRERRFTGLLIRCHGDYHLGQVLYTGQDFIIIDFEGEPARPLRLRRAKGSPLRDVAGMLRSFHYAAHAALMGQAAGDRAEDFARLEPAAHYWYAWVAATYLRAYLEATDTARFLPASSDELRTLLDTFLLEKAAYELGYELNNRPDWINIPIEGFLQLMPDPD